MGSPAQRRLAQRKDCPARSVRTRPAHRPRRRPPTLGADFQQGHGCINVFMVRGEGIAAAAVRDGRNPSSLVPEPRMRCWGLASVLAVPAPTVPSPPDIVMRLESSEAVE